ncbi:MAG: restriction endonuclease subunit S [Prevotella sp.]|nr:restriction endonuclease subunit S [Prevotella sp.]
MVEWKKIGDIVKRNKGIPITAGQMSELNTPNGNVRVFAAGQTMADICEDDLPAGCANKKPSIIVKSRGYIDFEFYDKPFTHKNEMWSYSFDDRRIGQFIYYYLTTKTDYFRKKAKANSVKLPQLCVADTDNYLVPVPSLAEQNRIVGILDTFTSSIENLKQQIAERRKQYEYYRVILLSINGENDAFSYKLEDICNITAGGDVPNDSFSDYKTAKYSIPIISNGVGEKALYGFTESPKITCPSVTIAARGTIGYAEYRDYPFYPIVRLISVYPLDLNRIDTKYLYYRLKSYNYKVSKSGIPQLTIPMVKKVNVFLPSHDEQSRIVSILDTFEASISNLEAQLKQREKQYEYYRNKLLTFE